MSSISNGSATVESLAEVFRCFICMEKLRDARLCPHCSKLCCYPCIRRWLTNQQQQCPHCRVPLHLSDLVICRWAEEVTLQLDTLKTTEKHDEKDKCEIHKEKLTVYCSSCSKCICHQCALFNGSHVGHTFLPLDDVYKTNISVIHEQLRQLKRRHVEFICLIQDVERNVEKVNTGRDERFREIRNTLQTMQLKLDEQFQTKLDALNVQHAQYSRETELIERTLHDIEHRIASNGKAEVIVKQKDFLNSIKTLCRKPMTNFIPISPDFPSELLPEYHSRTFVIRNFSILQQNIDPIYSQSLDINGLTWRLKVYPDGNGTVRGNYLSVFLELAHGLNGSSKYEYRIEMVYRLSEDPTKNIIREFASDFEVGECWGYNKFFLLSALTSEGFINEDMLILRFQVRPSTYQQKSRDQQWYIKQLESENEQLHDEIRHLREQFQSKSQNGMEKADNDDDDDEYTTLESDQIDTDEDVPETSTCHREDESLISAVNPQPITTDPTAQTGKDQTNSPLITDEDFILADILERSAIDGEETNPANDSNNNPTGDFCSYQSSLNNLIFLNSQIYQFRTDPPAKFE